MNAKHILFLKNYKLINEIILCYANRIKSDMLLKFLKNPHNSSLVIVLK